MGRLDSMKVTLQEIAEVVDLSVSTVSRALNGHPAISEQSAARIRRVAEELKYRRRKSHRRLDTSITLSSQKVAMITLGLDRSLVALPTIAAAINGAEAALSEVGSEFRLFHVPHPNDPPPTLKNLSLDGVILHGPLQGNALISLKSKLLQMLQELPAVWVVGRPQGCRGDAVVSNDYGTGTAAAEYLVERGHRHLAIVNPKPDHVLFIRREDGFIARARRLGAKVSCFCQPPDEGWQLPLTPPLHVEAVQRLVDQVLDAQPRPTAIFAVADSVATLVYRALGVRGVKIGEEMSVISGNNDRALIAALHPSLTTFDIHAEQLGRLAVRQLANRLVQQQTETDMELTVASTLVEGESVVELRD